MVKLKIHCFTNCIFCALLRISEKADEEKQEAGKRMKGKRKVSTCYLNNVCIAKQKRATHANLLLLFLKI